jgi:hypothetical protein
MGLLGFPGSRILVDLTCFRWVKHGTGTTPPTAVYLGHLGIDPRYSSDNCLFGRAAYFAERALYSHDYSHGLSNGTGNRQMFLARIAAGVVDERTSIDRTLRHPEAGHHSVRGKVREPDYYAYMLYETKMSYPAYLITYKP